ncbi:MAG: hypothetical protein Q7K45_00220 [Nanoarchaeota archaeon]|nr:hypothetical protein [Nanoarchaeota archaeon]
MIGRKEVKELFNLAEVEIREEELRRKALYNEEIDAEHKAQMLEYTIEHLHPSALIAVHQTNHFPDEGKIKPTGHSLLNLFEGKNPQRIIQDLQLKYPRMTIHFTLNYPVEGVAARGQWVTWNGKYAILIPVKDIMSRIVCLNPVDTWIIGELKLPASAEILMPEEEYNVNPHDWQALAGKAKITPYPKSEVIHEAVRKRIAKRGYAVTFGGDHGWYEGDDLLYIKEFIRKSTFLSFDEKDRLIALAVKKGYRNWNKIFLAMADTLNKMTLPHGKTVWREIEIFSEEVYGVIFEPKDTEEKTLAREMKHKLEALAVEAHQYKEKVRKILHEEKFTSREEKVSLQLLMNELEKIGEWEKILIGKVEHLDAKISWKQFLQQEKII